MPAVSVIIPIYNAEPYLHQCLESVRAQTLLDIEILCVNDGSTDTSLEIIQSFAQTDTRFIVIDKPNGGYGQAVNCALARAQGSYISIVEPDDFIDAHMYEDLISFACGFARSQQSLPKEDSAAISDDINTDNEHLASEGPDIIKGGYWEFYDGRDGLTSELVRPYLMKFMGPVPQMISLEDNAEIIGGHPSIWSALYRRAFLNEQGIKFVEAAGGGWVDNPFMLETYITAKTILWIPSAYYYYRRTNPSASSFLKDYHLPFDRMREMRAVLDAHRVSDSVRVTYYRREFDYIYAATEQAGFSEMDDELASLIDETLACMDETLIHSHPLMRADDVAYYDEFRTLRSQACSLAPTKENSLRQAHENAPCITYIVPVQNDGRWISKCLDALLAQPLDNFEVLCVNCGCIDRSLALCRCRAASDERFKVIEKRFDTLPSALNNALSWVRGTYFFIMDSRCALKGTFFSEIVRSAVTDRSDVVVIDTRCAYAVRALRAAGQADIKDAPEFTLSALTPSSAPFLLSVVPPGLRARLYRTEFTRTEQLAFKEKDILDDGSFGLKAVMAALRVTYACSDCMQRLETEIIDVPSVLALSEEMPNTPPSVLAGVLGVVQSAGEGEADQVFMPPLREVVLEAFMYDIKRQPGWDAFEAYCRTYLEKVSSWLQDCSAQDFQNVCAFNDFQLLARRGRGAYLAQRVLTQRQSLGYMKTDLESLQTSLSLRVGQKVSTLARALLPKRFIQKIRH